MSTDEFASDPAVSAGQQLRRAREGRGWTLVQVAGRLHIRPALVEALECDDYAPFGAVTYARGQLRNYAALLGLDASSVLQGVTPPRLDQPGKLARNAPELHPGRPWLVRLGGAAVVLVLAVLGALWADAHRERAPQVAQPALSSGAAVASGSAPLAQDAAQPRTVPAHEPTAQAEALPAEAPAAGVATGEQPELSGAGQGEQQTAPAAEQAGSVTAAVDDEAALDGQAELLLRTRAVSWAEVSDSSGRRLIYDLLSPGREHTVRGLPPLRLLLGNAPVVEVIYNGAPVALPAGEHVVRMRLGSAPSTAPAPPVPQP
nr:XRE family transcriptional regulator [uncultured bacterium]BAH90125.1 XRE family transcriptional regulator [uncultured bacterium]BAH90527.1 XRE family transcriptional regulator [uncultured bacterium]